MKKLILLLLVIVVSCFCNSIFAGPWTTDTSKFHFAAISEGDENGMPVMWMNLHPNIAKEYEKRFGAFPNLVLWKDNPEAHEVLFGIGYHISRDEYEKEHPWGKPVKIMDIEGCVFWKLENIKTGSIRYYPFVSNDEELKIDEDEYYTVGWSTTIYIDAWSLDLDDNTAYNISPEIWEGSPTSGKLIASSKESVVVVKSNHDEPLDYYMEKYVKNELANDPDFLANHVMIYPFHDYALSKLFFYYSHHNNCDSLKWVAAQWLYTLEYKLDPFYTELIMQYPTSVRDSFSYETRSGPRELTPQSRSLIMSHLQDVCGDTLLPPPWHTK